MKFAQKCKGRQDQSVHRHVLQVLYKNFTDQRQSELNQYLIYVFIGLDQSIGLETGILDEIFYNFLFLLNNFGVNKTKLNSVALVRERTIPTERPPPVGEVSANFCGYRSVTWSAQRVPTAVNLCFLDLEPLFFIQVAPQLTSRGSRG